MKTTRRPDVDDDIPEQTEADLARAIPRTQRERILRGRISGGDDIVALRRFVGLTQEEFAKALALMRTAARHPRVLREDLAVRA